MLESGAVRSRSSSTSAAITAMKTAATVIPAAARVNRMCWPRSIRMRAGAKTRRTRSGRNIGSTIVMTSTGWLTT